MIARRNFLSALGAAASALVPQSLLRAAQAAAGSGVWVNDVHSRLNPTRVAEIARPRSTEELQAAVAAAARAGRSISIAGGRHAMGGQQFATDSRLIDTTALTRVLAFDRARGLIEVEAGIQWPALIDHLVRVQAGAERSWAIVQKQTGADRLCLGGALAANAHGRGLRLKPIVQDVESLVLVDAEGRARRCSRTENAELFRLAIGGYGLFGAIASVTLRLRPRVKLQRVVELGRIARLMPAFEARIAEGYLYGDFQFSTDPSSEGFLRAGVFSCYRPVPDDTPLADGQAKLAAADWLELLYLTHADRRRAFEAYSRYYLSTSGQVYWSDTHQLSLYVDDYHRVLDARLGAAGTEMIAEVYVPRAKLAAFMEQVRADFLAHDVPFVYGTIRLIERDDETFLAWAREPYACVIFNLHVGHTQAGVARAARDFRRLIDRAVALGGSYFPTYHRWATRAQVLRCHPRFVDFLREKRRFDPEERFQSEWYRHYRAMFADAP